MEKRVITGGISPGAGLALSELAPGQRIYLSRILSNNSHERVEISSGGIELRDGLELKPQLVIAVTVVVTPDRRSLHAHRSAKPGYAAAHRAKPRTQIRPRPVTNLPFPASL